MDKDYKTTIKIEGDSSGAATAAGKAATAVGGISKAAQQVNEYFRRMLAPINSVRTAISGLMGAFGVLYLAFEGVNLLVKGFTALKEKMDEIQYAAARARARLAVEYNSAAAEADRLVESQGRLNDLLKDELGLLEKRKELRELKEGGEAGFADESTRIRRAVELAGETDPNKRQLLQDRYAAEDEQRERTRRDTQLKNRISDLDEEDSAYTSKAKAAATRIEQIDRQIATQTDYYNPIDGSTEVGKKGQEEILERLKALRKARDVAKEEKKTFEEEAAYRKRQIEVLQQQRRQYQSLGSSAAVVADARWREKEAAQQRDRDDLDQRLERRRSEEAWKQEFKDAGPEKPEERQLQMLQEREDQARTEMGELRKRYDAEMAKDVQSRDEQLLDELKTGILDAQDKMFSARSQREDLTDKLSQDAQNQLDQYADRFAGAYAPGSNRLTAMGLGAGSGVDRVQEQMASSLKELVRLGQQQIAEIKAGNIRAADNVAVYGD